MIKGNNPSYDAERLPQGEVECLRIRRDCLALEFQSEAGKIVIEPGSGSDVTAHGLQGIPAVQGVECGVDFGPRAQPLRKSAAVSGALRRRQASPLATGLPRSFHRAVYIPRLAVGNVGQLLAGCGVEGRECFSACGAD